VWFFSDNKKLDQVIGQINTLTQLTLNLGEYVMAKFEDVEAALGLLNSEVSETAAQVKKLRDEVAALKEQLPGISEAELSTRLESIVTSLTGAAESLDLLQDKLPKPEDPA
jgi:outer membrane murein-binding lipoprotein Lpp